MKKISYIIAAFIGAVALASCDTREPALKNIVPCVIGEVPSEVFNISDIMQKEPERQTLFTLTWSPAQMKTNNGEVKVAPVIYNIEFDAYGNGFNKAKAYSIISGNATSLDIPVMDFSTWVLSNIPGAKPGSDTSLEVRIKVQYGDAENYTYSQNAQVVKINPFGYQPLYIIGDRNSWDNTDTSYRLFKDNNDGGDFTQTYTGKFKGEFKLISKGCLGTDDMFCKVSDTQMAVKSSGEPFKVEQEGYYTLTVNIMDMTYSITPYARTPKTFTSIGFMGQWCNWVTNDPLAQMTPTEYDPHIWSGTFDLATVDYGVKFCGNLGWGDKWQPDATKTEEIPFGIAEYNKDIAGDPNFSLGTNTGTYFVMLNDITGHYIIEKQ